MNEFLTNSSATASGYSFGDFTIDLNSATLTKNGKKIKLRRQSFDVLVYLIENGGRLVSKDELHSNIWGAAVVTRDSLTHCLLDIRKALGDESKDMIQTVPRRGYIVELPVEIISAEGHSGSSSAVTNRDIAPDKTEEDRSDSLKEPGQRRALLVISTIAVAAIIISLLTTNPFDQQGDESVETDAQLQPFAAGRVELPPLQILGATLDAETNAALSASTFVVALDSYGIPTVLTNANAPAASRSELVLKSTLLRDGDRQYVDVVVTDAQTETSIWAARYEGSGDKVESLLDKSAAQVAYVIECGLFRRSIAMQPMSPELFGMWMRACEVAVEQKRIEFYEQMLEIVAAAPEDAASHSALATGLLRLTLISDASPTSTETRLAAQNAAQRALEIEPNSAEALLVLAETLPHGEWQQKEQLVKQALQGDTRYKWTRSQYALFLHRVGRLLEGTHFSRRTTAIVRGPNHLSNEAWVLAAAGRTTEALSILDESQRLWPEDKIAPWRRFNIQAFSGDPVEAEIVLNRALQSSNTWATGSVDCWQGLIAARLGNTRNGSSTLRSDCPVGEDFVLPRVLVATGDVETAFDVIDQLHDDWSRSNFFEWTMYLFSPEMAAIRRDPRFMAIAEHSGLASYWLETNQWPDYCSDPDLPYVCEDAAESAVRKQEPASADHSQ